jgi:hypothetical protein
MALSRDHVDFHKLSSQSRRSSSESDSFVEEEAYSLLSASDASDDEAGKDGGTTAAKDYTLADQIDRGDVLERQPLHDSGGFAARAKEAIAAEHKLSAGEAVRAYPMAIFWSLMVSMCVIMEGYDTIL